MDTAIPRCPYRSTREEKPMKRLLQKAVIIMLCLGLTSSFSLWGVPAPAHADSSCVSHAEVDALKSELERVKIWLRRTQQELDSLRQVAGARSVPSTRLTEATLTLRVAGNPLLGAPDAPLTLIEFSDYECPYCRRFVKTTLPALKAEYINTGKLRYVFRNFPLDQIHRDARKAAEAAQCAGEQGQYWAMHDVLFHKQQALQLEQLKTYARNLDLDAPAFDDCLELGRYAAEVQKDVEDGIALGVQGTPSFFLGKTSAGDTMQGIFLSGAQPITAFRGVIERLLNGQ
jgi:protein-disulfide isomerase